MPLIYGERMDYDTESPFTDIDSDALWWREESVGHMRLMDGDFTIGHVNHVFPTWIATPLWAEKHQLFKDEEEARAWLLVMYRMSLSRS